MDEKGLADRLNRDIHTIIDGHALPEKETSGEYREMLELAQQLARNDMSAQSHVRSALKQRLLDRLRDQDLREAWATNSLKGNRTMRPKLRPIAFALTALIVFAIAIGFTPAGQAFAQNIWQQVGPLIIINKPVPTQAAATFGATPTPLPGAGTISEPLPPLTGPTPGPGEGSGNDQPVDPNATPTPLPVDNIHEPLSDQMALEQYGFQVLQPRYLPEDYLLSEHQVNRTQDGRIVSIFVYTTESTAFDGPYLSVQQSTYQEEAPIEFLVGDANVSQVTVRGTSATFIEDARLMTVRDEAGNNVTLPVDYLLWEEDGIFFLMDATQLTQEEMIRIAESLQ